MLSKPIRKQFCVRKDSEHAREAAVSAVFGQGRVLELHSGTGKGDKSPSPGLQEQARTRDPRRCHRTVIPSPSRP